MEIPSGVIFIWTGLATSIPSGWERVTALDGKYIKGTADATDPNDTGGANTHSHSASANHSHSLVAHTHSISLGAGVGQGADASSGSRLNAYNHTHSGTTGAVSDASVSSVASTYASIDHQPPYYEVIFITPTSAVAGVPDLAVAFSDYTSFANNTGDWVGWYISDGNNSTPNLGNKYLKGATTDGNAGGTGGATTHNHGTLTHSHTQTHRHASVSLSAPTRTLEGKSSSSTPYESNLSHTHAIYPVANTTAPGSDPAIDTSGDTVEPAHTKLLPIQNRSGGNSAVVGIIGLWLGTLASIPTGWVLCDGSNSTTDMRGRFLKLGISTDDIGDTGGANTHAHSNNGHTHTIASHNHTHANVTHPAMDWRTDSSGAGYVYKDTTYHTVTIGNGTTSLASTDVSSDTVNNEPAYRTVAFIKLNTLGTPANSERSAKITGGTPANSERSAKITGVPSDKSQAVVIDHTKVFGSSDWSNFPILLTNDSFKDVADLLANTDDGGGDLIFSTDALGVNRIACDIVKFDTTAEKIVIWVKIPTLYVASNTTIYVWYNRTGQTQPARDEAYGSEAVWTNRSAVFHKPSIRSYDFEDAGQLDELGLTNTYSRSTAQKHGGSYSLLLENTGDAVATRCTVYLDDTTDKLHISYWFRVTNLDDYYFLLHSPVNYGCVTWRSTGLIRYRDSTNTYQDTALSISANTWHHIEFIIDGSTDGGRHKIILDGTSSGWLDSLTFSTFNSWRLQTYYTYSGSNIYIDDVKHTYIKDATSNENDGYATDDSIVESTGKIGDAIGFSSPSTSAGLGIFENGLIFDTSTSLSLWANSNILGSVAHDWSPGIIRRDGSTSGLVTLDKNDTDEAKLIYRGYGDAGNASDAFEFLINTWYYFVIVKNSDDSVTFYRNGIAIGTTATGLADFNLNLIGQGYTGATNNGAWDGEMEEFRISSVALDPDWIKTEYYNQNDPDSFFIKGTDNDEREAKLSGFDTANDSRSAKLSGKDTSQDERGAKLTGSLPANAERSAKITGTGIPADSERASKLFGKDTSTSEMSAKIHGKDTSQDSRSAKTTGGIGVTTERSAKLTGTGNMIIGYRSAKISGVDTAYSDRQAKVKGKLSTNDERESKLTGKLGAYSERGAKLSGKALGVAERSAWIKGSLPADSERSGWLFGGTRAIADRGGKLKGKMPYTDKYDEQSSVYCDGKYDPQGNTYCDGKYYTQSNTYSDKHSEKGTTYSDRHSTPSTTYTNKF